MVVAVFYPISAFAETEIPDWVKNNAEWWADNQISDDDFVKAMEWLVTNGVISIE